MKFVFAILTLIIATECTIYVGKRKFEPIPVEIKPEEYEENDSKSVISGMMSDFKEGVKKMGIKVKESMSSMKEKLKKARPKMFSRPWTWGQKETVIVDGDVKEEVPEMEEKPPFIPNELNPGAILTVSHDFLENFKNMFVPEIFDVFLSDPLDLQLDFGFIVLDRLYLGFDELDVREVELRFIEEINAVNFHFPETPLTVWIDIVLKLPMGKTYTARVNGKFYLDNPIIAVAFERDETNPFFAPRIILAVDDGFKVRQTDVNLRTAFPCMPNWLLNNIIWLFQNKINGAVTNYLVTTFMSGGSDLLYWVLDTYYPMNLSLGIEGLYINLLFLRKPIVKNNTLTVAITGQTFDVAEYFNDPDKFVPSSYGSAIDDFALNPDGKNNIGLSLNVEALQDLLFTIMSVSTIKTEKAFLTGIGIGGIGFGFRNSRGVEVNRANLCIMDARVILLRSDLTNPILSLGVTLCVQIHNLDLMTGEFNIYIDTFRINTTETVDSWIDSIAATFSLIDFSDTIKNVIAGHRFTVEKLKVELKPGMTLKPITAFGYGNSVMVGTGISYDSSLSEKTYFLESARVDPADQVNYSMSNDPEWLKKICGKAENFMVKKSKRRMIIV